MLRVVLAVALAVALLAVVTPALEDARGERTRRLTARELDRVASAAQLLAREESPGARRTLAVSFPGESPTAAPIAFVSLGAVPNSTACGGVTPADTAASDVLAYRIAGGEHRVRRVGVDLRVVRGGQRVESDSQTLVLRGDETYRLVLRLVRIRGRLTVVVNVANSMPGSELGKPPPIQRGTAPTTSRDLGGLRTARPNRRTPRVIRDE